MELQLDKDSFLDDVRNIRSIRRKNEPERTEGFMYLHESITGSLFDGRGFQIENIDFSKFTSDDLYDYAAYYNDKISPKINTAGALFSAVESAQAMFLPKNNFH